MMQQVSLLGEFLLRNTWLNYGTNSAKLPPKRNLKLVTDSKKMSGPAEGTEAVRMEVRETKLHNNSPNTMPSNCRYFIDFYVHFSFVASAMYLPLSTPELCSTIPHKRSIFMPPTLSTK